MVRLETFGGGQVAGHHAAAAAGHDAEDVAKVIADSHMVSPGNGTSVMAGRGHRRKAEKSCATCNGPTST
jgi:hypothetical protein